MPEFGITAAQIVGLFMESVFYGIYLVTFFSCMRVLLWRDDHFKAWGAINKMMVIAALLMLIFGTLDVAFGLRHNLQAFVYGSDKGVQPEDEFAKISEWLNVMKFANYSVQTFVGDGILIYRCYVIYNRRWWVVVLPILMWLATAVCSGFTIQIESTIGSGDLNQSQFQPFISSTLALTLATNLLTTSLIVYRIYRIKSRTANHTLFSSSTSSPYSRLIRTLIECGAMYTLSIVILFACYLADSNAILGVSNSVVQIIGITFNLLILNIDRGTTTQGTTSVQSNNLIGSSRNVPLHQLRIKTTTTTIRDMPETYLSPSQVKSQATNASPDENNSDTWRDSSTDVEKAVSPSRGDEDAKAHAF